MLLFMLAVVCKVVLILKYKRKGLIHMNSIVPTSCEASTLSAAILSQTASQFFLAVHRSGGYRPWRPIIQEQRTRHYFTLFLLKIESAVPALVT